MKKDLLAYARSNVLMFLYLAFLTFLAVVSVIYSVTLVAGIQTANFTYLGGKVLTPHVCAGDNAILHFQVNFIVTQPNVIAYIDSIWSVDRNTTVSFDSAGQRAVYTQPITVTRERTYSLPPLAPGKYEIREGAQDFETRPPVIALPFEVVDCSGAQP